MRGTHDGFCNSDPVDHLTGRYRVGRTALRRFCKRIERSARDVEPLYEDPAAVKFVTGGTPLRRWGTCREVGLAVLFLATHASSYVTGTVSSGTVKILRDIESSVRDRDVLLVDDILESGRTLAFAKDLLVARGARRVLVCTMLEKPGKRVVEIGADFVGFACPDVFVVGYGMDVAHSYRELPFIGRVVTAQDASEVEAAIPETATRA